MATVLDKIKERKSVKYARISIKVPDELKGKIEYICKNYDIDMSEYVAEILASSEINRVYNTIKKEHQSE